MNEWMNEWMNECVQKTAEGMYEKQYLIYFNAVYHVFSEKWIVPQVTRREAEKSTQNFSL